MQSPRVVMFLLTPSRSQKMKKSTKIMIPTILIAFLFCSAAYAAYIDFTTFSPDPDNDHRVTAPYSTTILNGTLLTIASAGNENLWWDSSDGFGIWGSGYENDEIETPEKMRLSFSSPLHVSYFSLTDLFYEGSPAYEEIGWYNFDGDFGGGKTVFSQTDHSKLLATSNGEYNLIIDDDISGIWFSAPGKINGQNHEFSIAGMEADAAAPVPEPATMFLLGTGLLAFAGVGRRKLIKK